LSGLERSGTIGAVDRKGAAMVGRRSLATALTAIMALTAASARATGTSPVAVSCLPSSYCATIVVTSPTAPGWTAGNGRVTSEPAGLDCAFAAGVASGGCQATFDVPSPAQPADSVYGTVTLLFTAADFSLVRSPSADPATPTATTQTLPLDVTYTASDPTLTVATLGFVVLKHQLSVAVHGEGMPPGSGRVSGPGIDCGSVCSTTVDHGKIVELTALPAADSVFAGWEGACQAQAGPVCRLVVTTDVVTDATFAPPPPPPGPSPGPPPPAGPPHPFRGDLLSARTGWSASGARLVLVDLRLSDAASGTLTLARARTIATKNLSAIGPGQVRLTIVVPARAAKGPVLLTLDLTGPEGARAVWGRSLVLPKPRR
jgi:Divergent InlB B-repeat domain